MEAGRPPPGGGPDEAGFVDADSAGNSLWSQKSERGETILKYSKAGELLAKGSIAFQGDLPAAGFWATADENRAVYKNYFFKDHMLVAGYGFRR